MQIEPGLYLVGSGQMGFDLTDAFDCNMFLFAAGDTYVLFDAGSGRGAAQTIQICRQHGLEPDRIRHLFLSHAHADHAGGAAHLRDLVPAAVYAGADTSRIVTAGDEEAVSLPGAREAGIYPRDYVYRACPVDHRLDPASVLEIGPLQIEMIPTPGHSHDHVSYLVTRGDRRYLVSGDAIFFGGKIVLQNTYDCSVPQSIASINRLATYAFDALLPGHLNFSLNRGKRHVGAACAVIARFGCPPTVS